MGSQNVAEAHVGIAAIGGGVDIGAHGGAHLDAVGVIVAEGVERHSLAEVVANGTAKAILGGQGTLPGHPVLVGQSGSSEVPASEVLVQHHTPRLDVHQPGQLTRSAIEACIGSAPESKSGGSLPGQPGIALDGGVPGDGQPGLHQVVLQADGVGRQLSGHIHLGTVDSRR